MFISKLSPTKVILFVLLAGALLLRTYKINERFTFDHDQEIPARAAYDFFINGKISLIGQEQSFQGFYLGPLHGFISFIPYGICYLYPDCTPYFYLIVNVAILLAFYFIAVKIFDRKIATIASFILAFSTAQILIEQSTNTVSFLLLPSALILFCTYQYFKEKSKYLILGAFIAGLATVNLTPVFIFSSVAFFVFTLFRKPRSLRIFILAFCAFIVNYVPLIVFNVRHNNLLLLNFKRFLVENIGSTNHIFQSKLILTEVIIQYYSHFLSHQASQIFMLLTLIMIALGSYKLIKSRQDFLLFIPFWIVIVALGFTFYKGHIPDYYFQQTLLPLVILVAYAVKKNIYILLVFAILFLGFNLRANINHPTPINYYVKKEIVRYIVNKSNVHTFNLYYDLPPGYSTGFSYLFKVYDRHPQENAKHLYILALEPYSLLQIRYKETFENKIVSYKEFGGFTLISVD